MKRTNALAISLPTAFMMLMSLVMVPAMAQIKNPDTYIVGNLNGPFNLDPHFQYDSASSELLMNVFDTLIFWDFASTDKFVGHIAQGWTVDAIDVTDPMTDLHYEQRYTFKLRNGITFHYYSGAYAGEGETVTVEDVEYTFERFLVMSYEGSAVNLIYEPLLRAFCADPADPFWGRKIDFAIQSDPTAQTVSFYLVKPYEPFLQILAQPYGAVMSKKWCTNPVLHPGNWPGTWPDWSLPDSPLNNYTAWTAYYNPFSSPIEGHASTPPGPHLDCLLGSGPYMFEYRLLGFPGEYALVKNPTYWQGWSGKHVNRFVSIWKGWIPVKDIFDGTVDTCPIPIGYEPSPIPPGLRCLTNLPSLYCTGFFLNGVINPLSQYCGNMPPNGTFNGVGFPADGFQDVKLRKAFRALFPFDDWIAAAYLGQASHPTTCVLPELPYYDPTVTKPTYDRSLAVKLLKEAWGGTQEDPGPVWTNGFTMNFSYMDLYQSRRLACEMLKEEFASIGSEFFGDSNHFKGEVTAIPVAYYPDQLKAKVLPFFFSSWGADFADPHSFVTSFMQTEYGYSAAHQGFHNDTINDWINAAISTSFSSERQHYYSLLQQAYVENCYSFTLTQPFSLRWERDWVQGWFHHVVYAPQNYAYYIWKEDPSTVTRSVTAEVRAWSGSGNKVTILVKNVGMCPERVETHIDAGTTYDFDTWIRPGSFFAALVVNNISPTGMYGFSQYWTPELEPLVQLPSATPMRAGDFGSGIPPAWFMLDDVITGSDLTLFIEAYKGKADANAMALADLGGGMPPSFGNFDGKVAAEDVALFIRCYKGLGP